MNIKDKPVVNKEKLMLDYEKEIDWPEGSPDEIIEYMNTLKESYKHLSGLTVESYWSGYEDCDYYLKGKIQESEEHYTERLEYEQDKLDQWELDYALHIERVNKEKQEEIDKKLSDFNKLKDELQKEGVL